MDHGKPSSPFSRLAAILGLAVLAFGLVVLLLLPEIRLAAWILLGLGTVLLVAAVILDFRGVAGTLTKRQGRLRAGATVMSMIFLGIIILANAISVGKPARFDATRLGQYTLTEQTRAMLERLSQPVTVLAFYEPGDPMGGYGATLLGEYARNTEFLNYQTVDPVAHPDQARRLGITQSPAFVFQSGQRLRVVPGQQLVTIGEGDLTFEAEYPFSSAILEVTGIAQKKVYFITGHGERDITVDYRAARQGLLNDLYAVATLNLAAVPGVPSDAAALIIAGPRTALSSAEVNVIDAYLRSGGQALLLVDPGFPEVLREVVSPWGVGLENGTVIDPTANVAPRKDIPLIARERDAFGLPNVYFPGAASLVAQPDSSGSLGIRSLLVTSDAAWLERDFDPAAEPAFDADKDVKGPLELGLLVAAAPPEGKATRLIVIGDSDFAADQHFLNANNGDLFLNAVAWLSAETELIKVRRNPLPFRRLVVDPAQLSFIRYSSMVFLPLAVLLAGAVVWWRRR